MTYHSKWSESYADGVNKPKLGVMLECVLKEGTEADKDIVTSQLKGISGVQVSVIHQLGKVLTVQLAVGGMETGPQFSSLYEDLQSQLIEALRRVLGDALEVVRFPNRY